LTSYPSSAKAISFGAYLVSQPASAHEPSALNGPPTVILSSSGRAMLLAASGSLFSADTGSPSSSAAGVSYNNLAFPLALKSVPVKSASASPAFGGFPIKNLRSAKFNGLAETPAQFSFLHALIF